MHYQSYNHNGATKALSKKIVGEIEEVLGNANGSYGSAPIARKAIIQQLFRAGWSGKVKIDPNANITITSIKGDIGLCLQFGNMARFYSDLLKLQHLYSSDLIKAAVCILPVKSYALAIGSNLANYDRFTNELSIFSETITVPILTYGTWEKL